MTIAEINMPKGGAESDQHSGAKWGCHFQLTGETVAVLRQWLTERAGAPEDPLFPTRKGRQLSRHTVGLLVSRHADTAATDCPSLTAKRLTPHTLRHYVDGRVMWPVEMTALAGTPRWPVPAI